MPASTKSRTAADRKRAASSKSTRRAPAKGSVRGKRGPSTRARRSLLASRGPALRRGAGWEPYLESHHVDIAALALIAVGIFVAGVAYAGWSGGALGNGAVTVMRFLFGALGYVVPAALVAGGALILLRELRPPARPLRTGTICLTVALTLG
ncbi:MAG: hypothetical protein ACRDK8_07535, partial [Solirubrobacteraceae bacterium]